MKLAFSTLGVPGLPIPDVLRLATTHGYAGVELRAHPEEPVNLGFPPEMRAETVRRFADAGVLPLSVAGYAQVAAPGPDEPVVDQLTELIHLAADLGAPFVRVFPGGGDQPAGQADAQAARRLGAVAPAAADAGVRMLLETHDSHRRAEDVERVLGLVGHRQVGALWDVLHTWLAGEAPETSVPALTPYLGYVQVKDVASADDLTPLPPGKGALPLGAAVAALYRAGWDGWLCWEYEKRWHAGAAPFTQVADAGREFLDRLVAG
ncbi:sugar phosphate isomerase/epimerase family protein [Streptomyces sp. NPDC052396]|uniref:sugar phosphate isomerase/epimerase family protein n=1 Tax=Streptomyces sp. NPDC052396 TaxID=3365689 RepID=UPI0037CF57D5